MAGDDAGTSSSGKEEKHSSGNPGAQRDTSDSHGKQINLRSTANEASSNKLSGRAALFLGALVSTTQVLNSPRHRHEKPTRIQTLHKSALNFPLAGCGNPQHNCLQTPEVLHGLERRLFSTSLRSSAADQHSTHSQIPDLGQITSKHGILLNGDAKSSQCKQYTGAKTLYDQAWRTRQIAWVLESLLSASSHLRFPRSGLNAQEEAKGRITARPSGREASVFTTRHRDVLQRGIKLCNATNLQVQFISHKTQAFKRPQHFFAATDTVCRMDMFFLPLDHGGPEHTKSAVLYTRTGHKVLETCGPSVSRCFIPLREWNP